MVVLLAILVTAFPAILSETCPLLIFEIVLFTVILCEAPSIFLKLSLLIKLNTLRFEINEIGHTSLNKTGIQIAKEKIFGAFFIMKRIIITAITTVLLHFVNNLEKILTVLILNHWLCKFTHALFTNPTFTVGDCFETCDFQSLTFLNNLNVGRCFRKRIMCTCI